MSIDTVARAPVARLLADDDPEPVGFVDRDTGSPFVVICDHAGNAVPVLLAGLGLPPEELARHIAIDIGALAVAERVAARLGAPLVFQRYSRLVVDCNRLPSAPDSMAETADGTPVPGNRNLDPAARQARLSELLDPYHGRIETLLDARAADGRPTLLVSVHSFTPALRVQRKDRPWDVGLCWHRDARLSRLVIEGLSAEPGLRIGENEPYSVDMVKDYSIPVHGEGRGLPYVEFEVRQDHLATVEAAELWAERLTRALLGAAARFDGTPGPGA